MIIRYAILEKTPFPGYWQQTAIYRLQEAEFKCFPTQKHYYERAIKTKSRDYALLYPLSEAEQIIAYLKKTCDYAEYKLLGIPMIA
jgi:hypothetical protein